MLSQTGLYALQALLHLAEQGLGAQVPAGVMAKELGIPGTYLAKVLQRLAREGILDSTRGARGGYRLNVAPGDLTVAAAVAPFEELRPPETCLLGGPCDLDNPCSAHARRSAWNAAALEILEKTTLADLLSGAPLGALASAVTPPSENAS
jgi:Rrf2 family iron-sulfur cluster assembly transcriptional regulator